MRSQIIARIIQIKDENYSYYSKEHDIITGFITKLMIDRKLSDMIHDGEK